ncbi:MAG: OmpA family protein [Marinilabiliaceae bacterium]|nr:OmpA family protein [Marinilabiliaceae bacterium]
MTKSFLIIWLGLLMPLAVCAQENPRIDKEVLLNGVSAKEAVLQELRQAEKYYRKGNGFYDEALIHYNRVLNHQAEQEALNYKVAVCYLWSSDKQAALPFLMKCTPAVAKDYYLLLGKAYQHQLMYDEAARAFDDYKKTLKHCRLKSNRAMLDQLESNCQFAKAAVADSAPVIITNMGPVINSYYDDYGAITVPWDSVIYFTSRRPKRVSATTVSRYKYNERVLFANSWHNADNNQEVMPVRKLNKGVHHALAGINSEQKKLYYYKGHDHHGSLYSTSIKRGKAKKTTKLKGRINHIAYQEASISVANDGTAYFITNRRGGIGGKDIWTVKQTGKNRFRRLKNLGDVINTPFDEVSVHITPDGQMLYFSSLGHEGMGGFDVFKSQKQEDGTWGQPVNLGYPVNSAADELFYQPTSDTLVALYASVRKGGWGGLDLYKVVTDTRIPFTLTGNVTDAKDGTPLPALVNVMNNATNELVAAAPADPTGAYSIHFEDVGPYRLQVDKSEYVSITDTFALPTQRHAVINRDFQMEKVMTPFTLSGTITDTITGLPLHARIRFTDLNTGSLLVEQWTHPVSGQYAVTLDNHYNVSLKVMTDGFFIKRDSINGFLMDSSLIERNYQLLNTKKTYTIQGVVLEEGNNQPLAAEIQLRYPGKTIPFNIVETDSLSGAYKTQVLGDNLFIISVKADGYFYINDSCHITQTDSLFIQKEFRLRKMKIGAKIIMRHILFISGKSTLKSPSFKELDQLTALLMENSNVKIEVSGHTDNVGSAALNKRISKARALAVRQYLISKGVEQDRITYQGYGFDQPIATNSTSEGRALNRRVEIKVLQ